MSEALKKKRPQHTNIHVAQILKYRLPLAGILSLLHRVSGALMFLLIPFVLFLLDKSLTSEISFGYLQGIVSHWCVKLLILALVWAYLHHFCAGIRFLLLDTHIGLDKDKARNSAAFAFAVSLPLTAVVGLKLFGVF